MAIEIKVPDIGSDEVEVTVKFWSRLAIRWKPSSR